MVCLKRLVLSLCLIAVPFAESRTLNGFDLTDSLIYNGHIVPGGPGKDGIPAIDQPVFVKGADNEWLKPQQRVMGVHHNGIAKAYPIAILNWHEIVNDQFGDQRVVITYCPLCGSGVVYRSQARGDVLTFGVSGLLYNSDVLLYDRQTDSLWSQLHHQAISGAMKGAVLEQLPSSHTTWQDWLTRHPDTLLLSRETGAFRDYDRNPYGGYEESFLLLFSVQFMSEAFHPKERVLGVEYGSEAKAYPFSELARNSLRGAITERLGGAELRIEYDSELQDARVFLATGEQIPAVNLFWFAWYAFHPTTAVYRADSTGNESKRDID